MKQFQVKRDDFHQHRVVDDEAAATELVDGEIRVRINRFAFTANNITYAVAGDMIGYWQFFPAVGDDAEGWGVIPVWGFAEVIDCKAEGVSVGEKLFGYFPPADELTMLPTRMSEHGFIDGAVHRSQLPAGYNRYRRVQAEAGYSASGDDERMLLWPLYATAFCLGDSLLDNGWYGAEQVLIISASSKTSIGLAYALRSIDGAPRSVGITSSRNLDFVSSIGVYDDLCCYDDVSAIDLTKLSVIVDMSGNTAVLAALHSALGDNMKFTVNVGLTHWEDAEPNEKINTERSEFFFAPGHIQKRSEEWGPQEFDRRSSEFVASAADQSRSWLSLSQRGGLAGLSEIYDDVCEGRNSPQEGIVIDMS